MNPVDSDTRTAQPLAPWVGGKLALAARLIRRIEALPHQLYAEPFVGMGGIALRKRRSPCEAINDRSGEVVNLFRIVQRHPEALLSEMRLQLVSRADFQRLLRVPPDTLTDIERAARFLALQRMAYGGKPGPTSFPARRQRPENLSATDLRTAIEAVHDRLARVTIEKLEYGEFIKRYDSPRALFYLDPPYYLCESYYGKGLFEREDFERLADLLGSIKGRWLMSINDHPEVRRIFRRFHIEEEPVNYRVGGVIKPVVELVVGGGG